MTIDPKIVLAVFAALTALVVVLQGLKKVIVEPIFLWILKKFFHLQEVPAWVMRVITGALTALGTILPCLSDGVISPNEWAIILGAIFGSWGLFDIIKKFEVKK